MGRTLRGFLSRRKTQAPRETPVESSPRGGNTEWITVESVLPPRGRMPTEITAFEASGCATALRTMCKMSLEAEGCSNIQLGEPSFIDGEWIIQGVGEREKKHHVYRD